MDDTKKIENLWAPWRIEYIKGLKKKGSGCVFCEKENVSDEREELVLWRGAYCFVIMNLYPYNNGHLMVVPFLHTSELGAIDQNSIVEMWTIVQKSIEILKKQLNAEGFNVGFNVGRPAGAGIDEHIHLHIVPRWGGDTNFMPIIGSTKVISQGLWDTYDDLKSSFNAIGAISSS